MSPDRDTDKAARSKLACQVCRANKVRCLRDQPSAPTCNRCLRYGLPCVLPLVNKKRGRPPKSTSETNLADGASINDTRVDTRPYPVHRYSFDPPPTQPDFNSLPIPNHHPLPFYETSRAGPSTMPIPQILTQPPRPPPQPPQPLPVKNNVVPMDIPTNYSNPSTHLSGSPSDDRRRTHRHGSSNVDVSDYLDPGERVLKVNEPKGPFYLNRPASEKDSSEEDAEGTKAASADGTDPVTLRILTEVEAHALVQLFIERLNPFIAIFDAKLHTLAYLRQTSSILFTSTLATCAKFFRQDLYPLILSHAQTILDRAVAQGKHDIGIIQSLMILTYWKVPEDTSAWIKIGLAIRMGYQGFWHVTRTRSLPADEMAAREVLNAERTWYCLFCFDRGLSQTFGLPTAIRPSHMGDPEPWAREHIHLAPTVDMHLALSAELCKLKDHWRALFQSNSPSPSYVESAIDLLIGQCDSFLARWFNKDAPPPDFHPDREFGVKWSILDFILILQRQRLELSPLDALKLDACLGVGSQIVDVIEVLAETGGLSILQDTASCQTSSLVVLLHKIFRHTTLSQKSLVISLLQRILLFHTRVSNGNDEAATAYVARFTRRILSAIGNESRAPSPKLGNDAAKGELMVEQPDFMAQLEEYIRVPGETTQTEVDDEQYWAMLFSAAPDNNAAPSSSIWGGQDTSQELLGYSNPFL